MTLLEFPPSEIFAPSTSFSVLEIRKNRWVPGRASREDVAPQSRCYRSKTVESGGQHGLAHWHGGAAMCCSATDQIPLAY